jgi:hypothetical protein
MTITNVELSQFRKIAQKENLILTALSQIKFDTNFDNAKFQEPLQLTLQSSEVKLVYEYIFLFRVLQWIVSQPENHTPIMFSKLLEFFQTPRFPRFSSVERWFFIQSVHIDCTNTIASWPLLNMQHILTQINTDILFSESDFRYY